MYIYVYICGREQSHSLLNLGTSGHRGRRYEHRRWMGQGRLKLHVLYLSTVFCGLFQPVRGSCRYRRLSRVSRRVYTNIGVNIMWNIGQYSAEGHRNCSRTCRGFRRNSVASIGSWNYQAATALSPEVSNLYLLDTRRDGRQGSSDTLLMLGIDVRSSSLCLVTTYIMTGAVLAVKTSVQHWNVKVNMWGCLCSRHEGIQRGSRRTPPVIRNLSTKWKWMVNSTPRPHYPRERTIL
jgi:hypothetical protein